VVQRVRTATAPGPHLGYPHGLRRNECRDCRLRQHPRYPDAPSHNAHRRTAAYVDDHAQGSRIFADLLQGYRDFLALCQQENRTLNATKTKVGYPSCFFFGFEVDINKGTRLADKNLDPVRRMVPPTNLSELRSTLGVFVQSARFIPQYAHIVAPLTALTRSSQGKPVPFLWDDTTQ
jgi:hypothetical protein